MTPLESRKPALGIVWALLVFLLTVGAVAAAADKKKAQRKPKPAKGANANLAEAQFSIGEFDAADEIAARVLEALPDDFRATRIRGEVALLSNRLSEAESWFERALELRPTHRETREHLARVYYRQDRFAEAAPLMAQIGKEARAATLAALAAGPRPYSSDVDSTVLPFEQTDPLPIVMVSVNGSEPGPFIIDTGGSEIILDTEWAAGLGIESLGTTKGTFGGDRQADVGHGVASTVGLGDMTLENVPVALLDTSPFSPVARGARIRGILGTVLFYHFLTTIDYPARELRLEPRQPQSPESSPAAQSPDEEGTTRIPFWLARDHYILARGRANDSDEALFLVDTGLAGLAFTCPESTIEDAGIELVRDAAGSGVGGGGEISIVPFMLRELSLGDAERRDLPGIFGPFPESLEHKAGFRIGGLISHGFLRPWSVTLDFDAMEIVLRRPAP